MIHLEKGVEERKGGVEFCERAQIRHLVGYPEPWTYMDITLTMFQDGTDKLAGR